MSTVKAMEARQAMRNKAGIKSSFVAKAVKVNEDRLVNELSKEMPVFTMKSLANKTVDTSIVINPILLMAPAIVLGSEVGQVTKAIQRFINIPAHKFFTNNKLNNKLSKVLVDFAKDSCPGYRYEDLYVEGYNKTTVTNVFGMSYTYYTVTKATIEQFRKQVRMIDVNVITEDDIKIMQSNFDRIGRGMQESSIDVGKDLTKTFGVSISELISSDVKVISDIKRGDISNNLDAVLEAKKSAKRETFVTSLGDFSEETDTLVMDYNGEMISEMKNYCDDYINDLAGLYYDATNEWYYSYEEYADKHLELFIYIRKIMDIVATNFKDDIICDEEILNKYLSAIYNRASKFNVPKEDVIKVAVAASCFVGYINKETNVVTKKKTEYVRFGMLSRIFGDIFVAERTGNYDLSAKLTVECVYDDVEDNTTLLFEDGVACDETGYPLVLTTEKYTGFATVINGAVMTNTDIYEKIDPTVGDILFVEYFYADGATPKTVADNTLVKAKGDDTVNAEMLGCMDEVLITGKTGAIVMVNGSLSCRLEVYSTVAVSKLTHKIKSVNKHVSNDKVYATTIELA